MERFPQHLRVATLYSELELGLLLFLLKALNFKITFVMPEDKSFGSPLEDGNWTGLYGLLQRGEADISTNLDSVFEEKTEVVDFSHPFYVARITFITQKPRPLRKNETILYPFSGTVWAIFILFFMVFSLLFSAMNHGERRYIRTLISTLGNVVGQPFTLKLNSTKTVFLFVGWIVAISFVIHCYKALLLSFLLAVPTKGIRTIADFASAVADGSVKCRTYEGSYIIQALMNSDDESYRIIGKALNESSQTYFHTGYFDPNNVQTTVFVGVSGDFNPLENLMLISEDSFGTEIYAIAMRKQFCCKKKLNKVLRKMVEGGFLNQVFETNIYRYLFLYQPNSISPFAAKQEPLKLEDLNGAILLLIIGHILAFLVFVGELLFYKMSRISSYKQNKSKTRKKKRKNKKKDSRDRGGI